jgi:hypothetical protein
MNASMAASMTSRSAECRGVAKLRAGGSDATDLPAGTAIDGFSGALCHLGRTWMGAAESTSGRKWSVAARTQRGERHAIGVVLVGRSRSSTPLRCRRLCR